MKYVEGFDTRLGKAIYSNGMTCRQVSIMADIPWSCMNGYMNEKKMPCCLYLVRLAKILKVSTDYLLGLKED